MIDWVAEPGLNVDQVARRAAEYTVVFFSANSMNWASVRLVAERIKEINPESKTCVGGPHPTHFPDSVLGSGFFDGLYRGEGDRWIAEVFDTLRGHRRRQKVPGLMHCHGEAELPAVVEESRLDDLDWRPAYSDVPEGVYRVLPVETSRGCRFDCSFCSIPSKRNWRGAGADRAVERLNYALGYLPRTLYRRLSIIDDTFTTDRDRIITLCSALPEDRYKGRLIYDARLVDLIHDDMIEALAPFTSDLLVGVEVANRQDGKRIKKASDPELVRRCASKLMRYEIAQRAVFSFIVGFPWQRYEDCVATLTFAADLILEFGVRAYIQWYWPMPGSAIFKELERRGLVTVEIVDEPGFYRSSEIFYSTRQITSTDVDRFEKKLWPTQLLLALHRNIPNREVMRYISPGVDLQGWEARRNPFLVEERNGASMVTGD